MNRSPDTAPVADGDLVSTDDMTAALTAAPLVFPDGSTQTFTADGRTTYVEGGRPTHGEWSAIENGKFSSFWPPDYRAIYTLRWAVEDAAPVGLTFIDGASGRRFEGRYH
jgi:hypothetical protein